ncbi:MAG: SDR family NAD(P)-dependent oxidoreductase [Pseudomonadota bacterium]
MTDHGTKGWALILGAASAMAEHAGRVHAARGDRLLLAGRSPEKLKAIEADLLARGASEVKTVIADLSETSDIAGRLLDWLDGASLERCYIFFGVLGDQSQAEADLAAAHDLMNVNYTAPSLWSLAAANVLEKQRAGALVAITSVAGDRGRMSNAIYGSAKAGLSTLVQGIDHRLAKHGAKAVGIKFGFVISPMTEGMNRSGFLWTPAEKAGQLCVAAGDKARGLIYAPFFWRFIMLIIRLVPTFVFNKTKL